MPELPEVETIVRGLKVLEGDTLLHLDIRDPRLREPLRGLCPPRRVESVRRRGKYILLELDRGLLIFHLRMTGRLLLGEEAPDDARLVLSFPKQVLYLLDRRGFATAEYASSFAKELGPEPFGDLSWLKDALRRSRRPVKLWLMDQRNIAGIGNIYASEILFHARIDPRRPANSLKPGEVEALVWAIPEVLSRAIAHRGTTFSDYRDARGERGGFQEFLLVYRREGKPCKVCGTPIRRIRLGGRSTFFCPCCQR